ncbi:hypothetical protein DB346_13040 [Verrucomicrobia bacterium LW23]|nr:hypothetical protein DB346_13040 [Verrucomicrobia bacterium LW23]
MSAALFLLTGCFVTSSPSSGGSGYADSAPQPASGGAAKRRVLMPEADSSALGTAWGETRESRVTYENFQRAGSPAGVGAIYYTSQQALREMGATRAGGSYASAGASGVEWAVRSGGSLPLWVAGESASRRWVAGRMGERYSIHVRNTNRYPVEVVLTVDGLDVMDGKSGAYRKRGYIVRAGSTLQVDGFRQSMGSVAAFRFSAVADSYASLRHGDTRNVGVIGIAVFAPKHRPQERNPFPGNGFATPPPAR